MSNLTHTTLLSLMIAGCVQGSGFLKQSGPSEASVHIVNVKTITQQNGAVSASISANSKDTQTVTASQGTAVSGATVSFPPGALAVDTQITIAPGTSIATKNVAQQLAMNTTVTSAGQAVTIQSSVPMDAATPFTLAIPVPSSSSLELTGDPFANLSVLYHVNKAADAGGDFTGVIPRAALTVSNGLVSFAVHYFGTYQAIITAAPVVIAAEVAAPPAIVAAPRVYFAKGPLALSFGNDTGQILQNFQGWVNRYSQAKAHGPASNLQTGVVPKTIRAKH